MKIEEYDFIVIGAGSGGLGASGVSREFGLKTLVIEKKARNVGGDCLNYGCVPSKALIHVTKLFHAANQSVDFGLSVGGKADINKVMEHVHRSQDIIRKHENVEYLRNQGIDVEIGEAKFVDENTIEANGKLFRAPKIVIATGSSPRTLEVQGLENVEWYNNETLFYDLKKLPSHLLVIGGGPIGCEMSQAFRRLGSEVTIINSAERLFAVERKDMTDILSDIFEGEGIRFYNRCKVSEFRDKKTAVVKRNDSEETFEINFDAALIAIGRTLNHQSLEVEKAGIKTENGKIVIDEYLKTSNDKVYVIGDAAGMYKFSHGAEKHVRLIWRNFIVPWNKEHSVKDLSWVTFTDPEIATFGLTEDHLIKHDIKYWKQEQSFEEDDRAIVGNYRYGKATLLLTPKKKYGRMGILGGSIIAPNAGELIQELMLIANENMNINPLFNKVYPYPVAARINQKTVRGLREEDLTPFIKKIIRWLYRL